MLKISPDNSHLLDSSIIALAGLTAWSGLVYRIFGLKWPGVILSLILSVATFLILQKLADKYKSVAAETAMDKLLNPGDASGKLPWNALHYGPLLAYVVLAGGLIYVLSLSSTQNSIISPWQIIPGNYFLIYGALVLAAFFSIKKFPRLSTPILILFSIVSFSVIALVYQLGYGFDYFVHSATLKLIDSQGAVEPRQLYYLGHYGLITVIHKLAFIGIDSLNRWLVPVLSAVLLPWVLAKKLPGIISFEFSTQHLLWLFILPFSIFTFTTPQNFAWLLLIISILYGLAAKNNYDLAVTVFLSITALIIHPIAGIPALIFCFFSFARLLNTKYSFLTKFTWLAYLASLLFFPLSFAMLEGINFKALAWPGLASLLGLALPSLAGQDNLIFNFIYFYFYNLFIIFIILVAAGVYILKKETELWPKFRPLFGLVIAFYFSGLLTKLLPFNYLIAYERDDFANRLVLVAAIFAMPFVIYTILSFAKSVSAASYAQRVSWFILAAILLTTSLYCSYPRFDRYFNSRGYSMGTSDLNAVKYIEANTKDKYIVLANQQVSAAALYLYGFNHYYNNLFYYPVPTGGQLYQLYLDMVYQKPTKATMNKAMQLAGVNQGYFVLNKYWTDFPKVLAEAKLSADSFHSVDDGQVWVFKYTDK